MAATFGVFVDADNCKVPTLYVLPKHQKYPIKVKRKVKIRYRYNHVPHLSQDTIGESNRTTVNTTRKTAKRLAISQQVITRLCGTGNAT